MKINELIKNKRVEILRIVAKYGASNIRIFGTVCRGDADEKSDLDLLVEMEKDRSLLDHAGFLLELEVLLGCKVDVVSEKGFKERVIKEAIPL